VVASIIRSFLSLFLHNLLAIYIRPMEHDKVEVVIKDGSKGFMVASSPVNCTVVSSCTEASPSDQSSIARAVSTPPSAHAKRPAATNIREAILSVAAVASSWC
jgi:hypothetical protein